ILLTIAHGAEVSDQVVELAGGELLEGGHLAVPERLGVLDVGAHLVLRAVGEDVLGDVQLGADLPSLLIDGVAADAVLAKNGEAASRGAVGRGSRGYDAGKDALEARDLDRGELPRSGVALGVVLRRVLPDQVERPGVV